MLGVALKFVADYQKSITEYPNIKTGGVPLEALTLRLG